MKLFKDIIDFLQMLTFADVIFFFAVLVLIVLIVILIYFIKVNREEEIEENETPEMRIEREITKDMKKETPNIEFTEYEQEQENKAIISYDELIKQNSSYDINYEKEDLYDDVSVKKVDLDNIISTKDKKNTIPKMEVRVISYAEEEAFLQALKQLQKELS